MRYEYQFSDGETHVATADADGRATVSFTPTNPGYDLLMVHGVKADGTSTDTNTYSFLVSY